MGSDQGRAAAKNQFFIVSQPARLLSLWRLIFSAGWSLLRLYWTLSTSVTWSLLGGVECSSGYSLYGLDATMTNRHDPNMTGLNYPRLDLRHFDPRCTVELLRNGSSLPWSESSLKDLCWAIFGRDFILCQTDDNVCSCNTHTHKRFLLIRLQRRGEANGTVLESAQSSCFLLGSLFFLLEVHSF